MFALCSDITIGDYLGVKPHEVKIRKSIYEYVDTAIIKVPITARLVRAGVITTVSAASAKFFNEGDNVQINLGYNGVLKTEFDGFISRINFTTPCEIECEGWSYKLRKKTYLKTFKKAQLRDVLAYLIEGTGIVLDPQIPNHEIDTLVINNNSGTEVLELIKKHSDETVRFIFSNNSLYAGLIFFDLHRSLTYKTKGDVIFKFGWNVIKDGNMKFRQAKNENLTVTANALEKDGTKITATKSHKNKIVTSATSGNFGENKIIHLKGYRDKNTMVSIVEAKHSSLSYDGYEGKITTFLQPYCEVGYKITIEDDKYKERSGNYLIDSVEVTYGMGGARRIVGIGLKL